MTEIALREMAVSGFKHWLGLSKAKGTHKPIIDVYNTQKVLPAGYKMKYTDAYCAATVSAVGIRLGISCILPECSCSRMIELYKKAGRWMEDDWYVPQIGDLMMYDWQDDKNFGLTDNKGAPDHVGMVCKVGNGVITVIEGNKGSDGIVGYREVPINGRYIRGFCLPDYAKAAKQFGAKEKV